MNSIHIRFHQFAFLLAMLLVVACSSPAPVKVLTTSTCELPCWHQIIPGISDIAAVKATLDNLSIVDQANPHNSSETDSQGISLLYRHLVGAGELIVELKDDKVIATTIRRPYGNTSETIEDIVSRFGEPEYFFASYIGPENIKLVVRLFYPSKGAIFTAYSEPNDSLQNDKDVIEPTAPIWNAHFVEPGTVESMLAEEGANAKVIYCIQNYMQPWKGYGEIEVAHSGSNCRSL
jgi:hypothetical protein